MALIFYVILYCYVHIPLYNNQNVVFSLVSTSPHTGLILGATLTLVSVIVSSLGLASPHVGLSPVATLALMSDTVASLDLMLPHTGLSPGDTLSLVSVWLIDKTSIFVLGL